jgi:hypothetical protein
MGAAGLFEILQPGTGVRLSYFSPPEITSNSYAGLPSFGGQRRGAVPAMATSTSRDSRANGFEIFADCSRWCARRMDGLVEGIFVSREDAVRFARRETWRVNASLS